MTVDQTEVAIIRICVNDEQKEETGDLWAERIERFVEGQASLRTHDSVPCPPSPYLLSGSRPATHRKTEKEMQLANGRGGKGCVGMESNQESLTLYKSFNTLFLWVTFSPPPRPFPSPQLCYHSPTSGITPLTSFSFAAVFTCMCFFLSPKSSIVCWRTKTLSYQPNIQTHIHASSFLLRQSHIFLILVRFTYILLQKNWREVQCWNFRTSMGGQEPSMNRVVLPARQAT